MRTTILLLAIILSFNVFGQNNFQQTIDIEKMAKFHTLRLENNRGKLEINSFCGLDSLIDSKYFKTKILENKGFNNYVFIKVEFAEDNFFDFHLENINHEHMVFFEFILAYDKIDNLFFKLKGFINNEFPMFYKSLILKSGGRAKKILFKKNKKANRLMTKFYHVEGIDLGILLKNINDINNWKIPELRPSPSRLLVDEYGGYNFQ